MCEPLTALLLGGAASLGSSLLAPKPAAPPPIPASTPGQARAPGAKVRVGDGQDDETTDNGPIQLTPQEDKRVFGRPVGGLGRSGLAL